MKNQNYQSSSQEIHREITSFKDQKPEQNKELEDVIGPYGPWQRRIFLIACVLFIPHVWHVLAMLFFAPNIDYWCKRPAKYSNLTNDQWKALAIPLDSNNNDSAVYKTCKVYENFNISSSEVDCTSWEYDLSFYRSTIIDQWDLVCGNGWLVSLSTSIYMAGFLSSVFISGQLADRFGRRPIILLGIAIFFASALACTFSTSYVMFTTLRYFVAFGASGAVTTAFVLLMEVIGAQYRTVLGVSFQFGWALGYVLLPALAWFVREWSNLHLTLTVPWILLCSFWWLLPESPRWLITHGKVEQVEKEIETALRINHKNVTDIGKIVKELMYKETREEENKNRHATFFDLLKTPNMRKKTLNSFFAWFVIAFVYYGLSLSTNDLGGDPYINFFVSGAVEFPSYAISIFVIKHLGRRIPLVVTMVLGGLACMLTIPIPDYLQWLTVTLAMFGKFCISASFGIVYVYSAELFPTVVRNVGVGSSSMCARVGSMVAPFVKELSKATNNGVPLGIFGGLSVVSGILILLLPETNNMPLPDTLEEGEAFGKKPPSMELESTKL